MLIYPKKSYKKVYFLSEDAVGSRKWISGAQQLVKHSRKEEGKGSGRDGTDSDTCAYIYIHMHELYDILAGEVLV